MLLPCRKDFDNLIVFRVGRMEPDLDSNDVKLPYRYERGDGRIKHCWNRSEAGFEPCGHGQVGKCANTITDDIAQGLLETGLYLSADMPDESESHPEEIFNVYQGVIYVAVPTRPSVSYHGYPYKGRLPKRLLDRLRTRAMDQDYESQFKKWTKTFIR